MSQNEALPHNYVLLGSPSNSLSNHELLSGFFLVVEQIDVRQNWIQIPVLLLVNGGNLITESFYEPQFPSL